MRAAVIINPISGHRGTRASAASDRETFARAWLTARGLEVDVVVTTGPGHAESVARSCVARGFDRVVAWGGDGTANEVAGALVRSPVTFGLIRSGSGNGFARSLRLPLDPAAALSVALDAPARAIDVGWLGPRHFLNVAGIGFDAFVASAFNRRRVRGPRGYFIEGLSGVWSYRPTAYTVALDGRPATGPFFLVAFANGREYGNGFVLAHNADLRDGLLEVVAVENGSPWRQLWRGRRLVMGVDRPAEGVQRSRVKTATISGQMLLCHVDGEGFEATGSIDVRVEPGAIRVAVPD